MNSALGRRLLLFQWAAGACDTGTGILLVLSPRWTFSLMRLKVLPQPVAFARFVGVFVLCVGLSYLWAAVGWPLRRGFRGHWQAQWSITALVRSSVALLLACQIAFGAIERGWFAVVLTDGILALIQWVGLARGWLRLAE